MGGKRDSGISITQHEGIMKPLQALLFTTVALLLTACQWNIGGNILTAAETYVALDYHRPLDGKVYRVGAPGGKARYYARLREVRYHLMPGIVHGIEVAHGYFRDFSRCGSEPTGRVAVAELEVDFIGYREVGDPEGPSVSVAYRSKEPVRIEGVRHEVEALPAGAVAVPYTPCADEDAMLDGEREPESTPGPLRRAAAATCSYTLDPLLSVTTTAVVLAGYVVNSAVVWPLFSQMQQQSSLEVPSPGDNLRE